MTLLSEHIATLQRALAEHGDLPVTRDDSEGYDTLDFRPPEVLRRVELCLYSNKDYESRRAHLERKQELLTAAEKAWSSASPLIKESWGSQEKYLAQVRSNLDHSQRIIDSWDAAEKFILI